MDCSLIITMNLAAKIDDVSNLSTRSTQVMHNLDPVVELSTLLSVNHGRSCEVAELSIIARQN